MTYSEYARLYIGYGGRIFIDYYNASIKPLPRGYRVKYTDAWCATFASVVMHACHAVNPPYECSVYQMWKKAKARGYIVATPESNDFIVYDWKDNGTLDHVGIVESVKDGKATVIEGNYNNKVGIRKVSLKSKEIEGFFRVPESVVVNNPSGQSGQKISDALIMDVIKGKYGNGKDRKENLERMGYNYEEVQKYVNGFLRR